MDILRFIVLCFSIYFVSGCVDSTVEQPDPMFPSFDYTPLSVGQYHIYQVDSIVFDTVANGVNIDQVQWLIRERVTDTLRNNANELVYRIERSQRKMEGVPWEIMDIWTAQQVQNRYERVEDNLRFIKMVMPLQEGQSWNGNTYIDVSQLISIRGETIEFFKNWQYEVVSFGLAEEIGNQMYEDVATLQQADDENLIEIRFSQEKYARGVGLVYRELQIMDTQCGGNPIDCENLPWEEKAQKGIILRQTLIESN